MNSPWFLWKVAHVLFQCAFVINHSITVYYWLVLWPFVIIKKKLYMEDYSRYEHDFTIRSFGNHGLPSLILLADWLINSINVSWHVLPLCLAVGVAYMIVNLSVVIEQGLDYIYPTHNWKGHPWEAFAFTILLIGMTTGVLAISITV